jgi:hypothetical protein
MAPLLLRLLPLLLSWLPLLLLLLKVNLHMRMLFALGGTRPVLLLL